MNLPFEVRTLNMKKMAGRPAVTSRCLYWLVCMSWVVTSQGEVGICRWSRKLQDQYNSAFFEFGVPEIAEGSPFINCMQYSWRCDSQVLRVWLTGTEEMSPGYWGSESRVLRIWLTGIEDMTHEYRDCDSRVLSVWLTGTENMIRGYWGYQSGKT